MKLTKIYLKNFGVFKDTTYTFPEKGILYLHGLNLDSSFEKQNGCGKTTFLSSIPFVLFGRGLYDSDKKKLLLRDYIKNGCNTASLSLVVENNGETYCITREVNRTGNNFLELKRGEETLQGQFCQDFLQKNFGLSFSTFVSCNLFGQGIFNSFLKSSEEEKVGLLEDLFHLKELEDLRKLLKERYSMLGDVLLKKSKELSFMEVEYKGGKEKLVLLKELEDNNRKVAEETIAKYGGDRYEEGIEYLSTRLKKIQGEIEECREIKKSLEITKEKLPKVPQDIARLRIGSPCPLCGTVLEEFTEKLKANKEASEKAAQKLEGIQEELDKVTIKLVELVDMGNKASQDLFKLTFLQKEREKEIRKAESILAVSKNMIEEMESNVHEKEEKYLSKKEEVDNVIHEREQLNSLRNILGEKELRGKIVEQYITKINYYCSKYVGFLTNGEIDLKFSFSGNSIKADIIHRGQGNSPYLKYSGGERRRVDIGVFLAFNRVNKHILNSPLDILLLDEALDMLDQQGIESVIELLKREEEFGLVLVTGHQEDLENYFPRSISLVKKGGFTVFEL